MPDIPEEAVERAREALEGEKLVSGVDQHYAAWKALQASGALFLTVEEKRALLEPRQRNAARPSARQKLEESL